MVELTTVSAGVLAADTMLKTASVRLIEAHVICPGKYIVLAEGVLSAVQAAIASVEKTFTSRVSDTFILGNPHEGLFPALYGSVEPPELNALGVVECFTAPSALVAADMAAKTAQVVLLEIRLARGMCGKSFILLTGELAAVQAAVSAAEKIVSENGLLLDTAILPNPDPDLWKTIL